MTINQFEQQAKVFYEWLDSMPTSFLNEILETLPAYVKTRKLKAADELIAGKQKMLKRAHLRVIK